MKQISNNKNIVSPCINKCKLNKNDVCTSCYRSISEIMGWGDKPNNEKLNILYRSNLRKQKLAHVEL
ncbi:DUF1289 domain-containing protein [Lentisphaera profundi]|uniref:DUF1289 domain-containing protein n=1 Tax=Lentisphaera profundi TaxID=1658616 RepID=UPI003B67B0F4